MNEESLTIEDAIMVDELTLVEVEDDAAGILLGNNNAVTF